jgi:hypothetical protein
MKLKSVSISIFPFLIAAALLTLGFGLLSSNGPAQAGSAALQRVTPGWRTPYRGVRPRPCGSPTNWSRANRSPSSLRSRQGRGGAAANSQGLPTCPDPGTAGLRIEARRRPACTLRTAGDCPGRSARSRSTAEGTAVAPAEAPRSSWAASLALRGRRQPAAEAANPPTPSESPQTSRLQVSGHLPKTLTL